MKKVLIADKDPETQALYAHLVSSLGHVPILCSDGIAVLDVASAIADIDLVITDIDLPGAWGRAAHRGHPGPRLIGERPDPGDLRAADAHRAHAPFGQGGQAVVPEAA